MLDDFTQDLTDFILVKSDEELALLRYAAGVSEQILTGRSRIVDLEPFRADRFAGGGAPPPRSAGYTAEPGTVSR